MYNIVKISSYLIRQFLLPNPFINLFKEQYQAEIANWLCGFIFIKIAYRITGSWYYGEDNFKGSIGFFVNYFLLTGLFIFITKYITDYYMLGIIYLLIFIMMYKIEFRLFTDEDKKMISML